jgi:hypothetical protein
LTAADVKTRLRSTADIWGSANDFGAGKVNAYRALMNLTNPPMSASIVGPSSVRANTQCNWLASVSGTPPFTYYWTKDGSFIGSGSEVTTSFAMSGTIAVQVWDANGSGYDSKSITVTPSAPQCLI